LRSVAHHPPVEAQVLASTRRTRDILGLLALTTGLAACGGGDDDGIACTAEARVSVALSVVDGSGSALADVTVAYRVDGGSEQTLSCGPAGTCELAYEVRGTFDISARKAGHVPAAGTVTVTGDACHVQTKSLTLVLVRTA
jgi:hypothetical protein